MGLTCSMRLWLKIDLAVQALLIAGFIIAAIARADLFETAVVGYITLGGWQLLGMLVQQVDGRLIRRGNFRWWYHRIILGVFVLMLLSTFVGGGTFLWIALLFAAPIMAFVYFVQCYQGLTGSGSMDRNP